MTALITSLRRAFALRRTLYAVTVLTVGIACFATACTAWGFGSFPEAVGPEAFGVYSFESSLEHQDGTPTVQAGSHPYALTTTIVFNHTLLGEEEEYIENFHETELKATGEPTATARIFGNPKHVAVQLPAGLVVNPQATSVKCTEAQLEERPKEGGGCPDGSAVGVDIPSISPFGEEIRSGIYNMVPPPGVPAEFGVDPGGVGLIFHIIGGVRTGGDYGLSGEVSDLTQKVSVYAAKLMFWGNPSAESHDAYRGICATRGQVHKEVEEEFVKEGATAERRFDCPLQSDERTNQPLLTMPGSCTGNKLEATASAESWQEPDKVSEPQPAKSPPVTGCDALHFAPSLSAEPAPQGLATESPSGLNVDLKFPLREDEELSEANLKDAVVTLPGGMAISPSAANGLGACPAEGPGGFNLGEKETETEGKKHPPRGHCPDSSKIGSVEVQDPLLEQPLTGFVYLAQPRCGGQGQPACTEASATNGELYGLYLEVEGQGALVKLAGTVSANPQTGQLTTTFDNNPQLPFSDLKLKLFTGPRAPLVTPSDCGTYTTSSQLTPWSGAVAAEPSSSFAVNQGCGHGLTPAFAAGTTNTQAGAHTPFSLTLSRQDGEQRLGSVRMEMPPGLLANIKSVAQCLEPQASNGECGEASLIGESTASAGPGEDPYWVKGGKVYLTGPYAGAPFGLSIVVPAIAGPFNLGNVIARASISVDSHTAQAIVTSSLPTIKEGIPLDVRTVNVTVDREGLSHEGFVFNPTSCKPSSVTGVIGSTEGALAGVSSPFGVTNCGALPFKPSFKASTQARTSKANGASLTVRVGSGAGQANIAKVRVLLPTQLPARLTTLQKACTEAQFNIDPAGCPAASAVGTATAVTPVLAHPLTGPAYLVSHGGAAFPDVVFVLQGEGIVLYLDGNTNIKKGITSSTFNSVPDAPISTFETVFPEGPHSVLATNIPAKAKGGMCGQSLTMPTAITGQNGAVVTQTTKIAVTGCPKKPKAKAKKAGKKKK